MIWKKPIIRLVMTMIVFCLSLDSFTLFGGYTAPGVVGRAMCVLRPLGYFATMLFSSDWSQLVSEYCATFPREPATSIIALMLKISVVALSFILTIAMFRLRENAEGDALEANDIPSEKHGIPVSGLASWIWVFVIFVLTFVLPTILGWRFIASGSPREIRTSLFYKLYQDVVVLGLYALGIIVCALLYELALLPILRRLFPNQGR
jgi:hypothetical protein